MFTILLLCLPQAQAHEVAEWWRNLTPEQQQIMQKRMQRLREMPKEARDEMRRRSEALLHAREHEWKKMGSKERKDLETMPRHDRRRHMEKKLRKRFEDRERHLRARFPGVHDKLHGRPIHDRLMDAQLFIREHQGEEIQTRLSALTSEGWVGAEFASFLSSTTPVIQVTVLQEMEKWRTFANASNAGLFQKWGLNEKEVERLAVLPPPEFLAILQRLRRGEAKASVFPPRQPRPKKRR